MDRRRQHKRLYGRRWRKLRAAFLAAHPCCRYCQQEGRTTAATEVDHITKHNGDTQLFHAWDNLQALCADHHRGAKARQERSGTLVGCDADGHPIAPRAHW